MHEKYSMNITPPDQEKQNLVQRSQGEEPTRKANAHSLSPAGNPHTEGAHPRRLPCLRSGSPRALATGHSLGAGHGPEAPTPWGQPRVVPTGPSESSLKRPAIALELLIDANSMSS